VPDGGAEGVLIAHGDATSGYSLYVQDGHLVHDLNVGGTHHVVRSDRPIGPGRHELGFRMSRVAGHGTGTLTIDGADVGRMETDHFFFTLISFSGLDIGLDRGSPVGHYPSPNEFTGTLRRVVVDMDHDQMVDHDAAGQAQMARE
jgi:arylsulfatase